jgi:hypothetical protein
VWERSFLEILGKVGFVDARVVDRTGYRTSAYTYGARITARR